MGKVEMSQNAILLQHLQGYLLYQDCAIRVNQVQKVVKQGVSPYRAYTLLFKEYLDIHEPWIDDYLPHMLHLLKKEDYQKNPYYQHIKIPTKKEGKWKLGTDQYQAYQTFVCNDFLRGEHEEVYPQIGFFSTPFPYPAVYEDGVLWMSVTPNEIHSMEEPIAVAKGNVLTFGLGLGYYAYMVSLKEEVTSVTIVEKDKEVIHLFEKYILPQFEKKEKIHVVCEDAYQYIKQLKDGEFDELFIDLWHDAGDGLESYRRLNFDTKKLQKTHVSYWIMKTIEYYL